MSKYIPSEKLIAEIKRLKGQLIRGACAAQMAMETNCKDEAYNEVLSFITSLQQEQQAVAISYEKELKEWMDYGPHTCYPWTSIPDAIKFTAEHFYNLGLNARKEE